MKTFIPLFFFSIALVSCGKMSPPSNHPSSHAYTPLSTIDSWFNNQTSNQLIFQEGKVYKILQDDTEGSRHQKFVLKFENSKTLLVAHNIDIAKRIPDLQNNDVVVFKGEYEWNKKGGVVHWTHRDPQGKHADGYLMHNGIIYD